MRYHCLFPPIIHATPKEKLKKIKQQLELIAQLQAQKEAQEKASIAGLDAEIRSLATPVAPCYLPRICLFGGVLQFWVVEVILSC